MTDAVPALLTVFLAFNAGGYFGTELPVALLALGVAVVATFFSGGSIPRSKSGLLALGAMLLFACWCLMSGLWASAPERVDGEATRACLYAAVLALGLLVGVEVNRAQRMLRWLTASMVAIALVAVAARTLPAVYPGAVDLDQFGLNYPITYANGLALIAAAAIVLCLHLTTANCERPIVRGLSAAAVPPLIAALILTRSVGVALACCAAVALIFFDRRNRDFVRGAVAALPPATVTAIVTLDAEVLQTTDATSSEALSQGRTLAIVAALCALDAGLVRSLVDRVPGMRLSAAWARRAAIGLVACACLILVLALGGARVASSESAGGASEGPREGVESRVAYWDAALEGFADSPLTGSGAGSFRELWAAFGDEPGSIRDAHSLYLETLAETGLVGGLLLATALGATGLALARLARRRERGLDTALAAVGALWLVVAAFEWVWELPAVSIWFVAVGGLALATPRSEWAEARSGQS